MEPQNLLQALHTAEKLKDTTRHCYTSGGRHESVAEHSWRIALMAYWLRDVFPEADMDKVIPHVPDPRPGRVLYRRYPGL